MRRRTQIVLAITFMVAALVCFFSYIYISQLLLTDIDTARETSSYLASEIAYMANEAVPDITSTKVNTKDPAAVSRKIEYYLSTDTDLNREIQAVLSSWPTVFDAVIVDANGKAILHSDPALIGKTVPERPNLQTLEDARFRRQLRMIYNPPTVYNITMPMELNG